MSYRKSTRKSLYTFVDFSDPAARMWYESHIAKAVQGTSFENNPRNYPWSGDEDQEQEVPFGHSDYCY